MDDLTHCTICFEAYGDSEDRVPRLLPCTHTFCSGCVESLIRNNRLVCPQDKLGHDATQGAISFPQNRYILTPVKDSLSSIDEFETCERHNRLKTLYCKDMGCNRPVCQLCMLQNHKTHDVEDIVEVIENMRETAAKTAELLSSNLHSSSRKAKDEKREMQQNIEGQKRILHNKSEYYGQQFDSRIFEIEEQTAKVNSIADSISLKSSFTEIKQKLKTLEEIRRTIHKTLKNNICYQLYETKGLDRQTQFTEERNAIWFNAEVESGEQYEFRLVNHGENQKGNEFANQLFLSIHCLVVVISSQSLSMSLPIARTFEVNYLYADSIQALSNDTIVVTGRDNGWGYDWDPNSYWNWLRPFRKTFNLFRKFKPCLTQYKASNGEVVFSKVTDAKAVGEVALNGKKCLVTFERKVLK